MNTIVTLDRSKGTPLEAAGISKERLQEMKNGSEPTTEEKRRLAFASLLAALSLAPSEVVSLVAVILEKLTGQKIETIADLGSYLNGALPEDEDFSDLAIFITEMYGERID